MAEAMTSATSLRAMSLASLGTSSFSSAKSASGVTIRAVTRLAVYLP